MSQTPIPVDNFTSTFPDSPFIVRKVDLVTLSDTASEEYLAYKNRMRLESHPDDPPSTLEDHLARWRNIPPFFEVHSWEVRDSSLPGTPIVGFAEMEISLQQTNQHLAGFGITVLPERRREGIAHLLLRPVATAAQERSRTLLMTGSSDRVPAGEAFLDHLGAERGLESHTNQLTISELDRTFLRTYREEGERRGAADFEMIRCDSPIPEEIIDSAAELFNRVAKDVPHGDLDMEPFQITPEEIREMDRASSPPARKT